MYRTVNTRKLEKVIDLFSKDSGTQVSSWVDLSRFFITSDNNGLMLRFNPTSIVIARVSFNNVRKGNGTKLLELLKEYALSEGFDRIVIENPSSKGIQKFMEKHKFVSQPYSFDSLYYIDVDGGKEAK